jgi:hypothetical protein
MEKKNCKCRLPFDLKLDPDPKIQIHKICIQLNLLMVLNLFNKSDLHEITEIWLKIGVKQHNPNL